MKLSCYLNPKCIYLGLEGETKEDIINQIIDKTGKIDKTFNSSIDTIRERVFERENEVPTAIGKGIAIPHARIDGYDDVLLSIGILKNSIRCHTADLRHKDDVKIFFLITAESLKNKVVLKIMSAITKIAIKNEELLNKILSSKNPQEIFELLEDIDVKIENRITAEDIMDPTIIPACPTDTLDSIARRLIIEEKQGFPVIDRHDNFLGEMTEKELISYGMPTYTTIMDNLDFFTIGEPFEEYLKNEKSKIIENIYRKKEKTITVDRKTPIMEICLLMVNKGVTRIYVVESNKYFGTILRSHIIKKVLHI